MSINETFTLPDDHKYFLFFKQGDERGLAYMKRRLHRSIFNYVYRIIANEFETNSIIQDAFLRAWDYRNRLNDIPHLINYLKYWSKWDCYAWVRESRRYQIVSFDDYWESLTGIYDNCPEEISHDFDISEKLNIIEQAIPFLPKNKETIIRLLKAGLSYKRVAKQLQKTYQHIVTEEKKCIKILKRTKDRLISAAQAESKRPILSVDIYLKYLDDLQIKIFKLYYEEKQSFQQIAFQLNITPFQLLKHHWYIKQIIGNTLNYGTSNTRKSF